MESFSNWNDVWRSFKVFVSGAIQQIAYDFLIVVRSFDRQRVVPKIAFYGNNSSVVVHCLRHQCHRYNTALALPYQFVSACLCLFSVSQQNPPGGGGPDIFRFFHKWLRIFNQFLHTYYTFLSMLDYKFLFNYPRFWRSYAILSATTQFT